MQSLLYLKMCWPYSTAMYTVLAVYNVTGGKCYNILGDKFLELDFVVKWVEETLRHDFHKFGQGLPAHCNALRVLSWRVRCVTCSWFLMLLVTVPWQKLIKLSGGCRHPRPQCHMPKMASSRSSFYVLCGQSTLFVYNIIITVNEHIHSAVAVAAEQGHDVHRCRLSLLLLLMPPCVRARPHRVLMADLCASRLTPGQPVPTRQMVVGVSLMSLPRMSLRPSQCWAWTTSMYVRCQCGERSFWVMIYCFDRTLSGCLLSAMVTSGSRRKTQLQFLRPHSSTTRASVS